MSVQDLVSSFGRRTYRTHINGIIPQTIRIVHLGRYERIRCLWLKVKLGWQRGRGEEYGYAAHLMRFRGFTVKFHSFRFETLSARRSETCLVIDDSFSNSCSPNGKMRILCTTTGEEKRIAAKLDGPCGCRVAQWSNMSTLWWSSAKTVLFSHAARSASGMKRIFILEAKTD